MTRSEWVRDHPYLKNAADLDALVAFLLLEVRSVCTSAPAWNRYAEDFRAGIPLLQSKQISIDLGPVATIVGSLLSQLAEQRVLDSLGQQVRALKAELDNDASTLVRTVHALLRFDELPCACAGLLCYVGWNAIAHYLHPLVSAFTNWRDEDEWCRNYCSMCGARPVMSQLVGVDSGRQRLLSCAFCRNRWRFRRAMCPFCDNQDDRCLRVLAIEGDDRLRIDSCDVCRGYLKTYNGTGDEDLFLADWSSIHLDILAQDSGLTRMAASLYQL